MSRIPVRYRRYPSPQQWVEVERRNGIGIYGCRCGHGRPAHRDKGKGACEGMQLDGPCECQGFEEQA